MATNQPDAIRILIVDDHAVVIERDGDGDGFERGLGCILSEGGGE